MSKIEDAVAILRAMGLPPAQQNERSALTLLALADLTPRRRWSRAARPLLRTVDIMEFMRKHYRKDYKPNTRETIRRQTLHQFVQASIAERNPDDPSRPTNSGKNCYALSGDALVVIQSFGAPEFQDRVSEFVASQGALQVAYSRRRSAEEVPLRLPNGTGARLSPGKHNTLQVAVIEQFGPRFAPGAAVLYVGDTARKHVVCDTPRLEGLGVAITRHDKLPDVILYDQVKNWLFLVEAVTSHGPVSAKRHRELEELLADCPAGRVYVTAFETRAGFRRFAADIAWETEVWIMENPGHMIHFNGPKFLGPYENSI